MTGNPDSGPASSTATWRPASRTICGGERTARPYRHRAFMSRPEALAGTAAAGHAGRPEARAGHGEVSAAAVRRVALVELVHQAPEPVRPESRLGGLAGDLAGRDDRPPPVIQSHGGEDGHLGMRPL